MNTPRTWSLRDYLHVLYRFKGRAAAVLLGIVGLAALWLALAPREYESQAKLFVRIGRENVALDPTVGQGETISLSASREAEMNSIVEHLRSRYILEKTLATVNPDCLNTSPEEWEDTLRKFEKRLDVTSPRASAVVAVQYAANSPQEAQKTLAALVDVYLDEHMRINRPTGSYDFFLQQSELLQDQLESAQAALRDAKSRAGLASIEGRRTALENEISALETQIREVGVALAASDAKISALQAAVDSLPQALLRQLLGGMPHDGLVSMQDQLFQLRMREQEVLSKRTDAHPLAMAIRAEVRQVEEALAREEPDRDEIVSALSAQEVANRASLAVQKEELEAQLGQLDNALVALNEHEVVIEKLKREEQRLETQYLTYVENMEEARMDEALRAGKISNVSIIQPATFVPRPVRPRKALILLLAFLGGSLGAMAVAVLSQQPDPTQITPEEVRDDFDLPRLVRTRRGLRYASAAAGGNGAHRPSED
jgi:uncharacterized protein involved in exopolysaccharide biosynthesis